jgi:hypothetical protein
VNGFPRPTQIVNSTKLNVTILPEDIATAGSIFINAVTPGPGGGTADALSLTVTAAAGPATIPISGAFTGNLQGRDSLRASDSPSIAQFQFILDDAGNVTFGALEEKDARGKISAVDLAGSSVSMDPNVPGRMIIHLNLRGAAIFGNELTAYLGQSGSGFIMVGTAARPAPQRGLGFLQQQTEGPLADASFGSGNLADSIQGR